MSTFRSGAKTIGDFAHDLLFRFVARGQRCPREISAVIRPAPGDTDVALCEQQNFGTAGRLEIAGQGVLVFREAINVRHTYLVGFVWRHAPRR